MSLEVYSPKIQAAIANWLSFTDSLKDTNKYAPFLASGEFKTRFGTLNFAGLEEIFRASGFNTHCLAVPVEIVIQKCIV